MSVQEERLKEKGATAHPVTTAQYGTYNSGYLPDEESTANQVGESTAIQMGGEHSQSGRRRAEPIRWEESTANQGRGEHSQSGGRREEESTANQVGTQPIRWGEESTANQMGGEHSQLDGRRAQPIRLEESTANQVGGRREQPIR